MVAAVAVAEAAVRTAAMVARVAAANAATRGALAAWASVDFGNNGGGAAGGGAGGAVAESPAALAAAALPAAPWLLRALRPRFLTDGATAVLEASTSAGGGAAGGAAGLKRGREEHAATHSAAWHFVRASTGGGGGGGEAQLPPLSAHAAMLPVPHPVVTPAAGDGAAPLGAALPGVGVWAAVDTADGAAPPSPTLVRHVLLTVSPPPPAAVYAIAPPTAGGGDGVTVARYSGREVVPLLRVGWVEGTNGSGSEHASASAGGGGTPVVAARLDSVISSASGITSDASSLHGAVARDAAGALPPVLATPPGLAAWAPAHLLAAVLAAGSGGGGAALEVESLPSYYPRTQPSSSGAADAGVLWVLEVPDWLAAALAVPVATVRDAVADALVGRVAASAQLRARHEVAARVRDAIVAAVAEHGASVPVSAVVLVEAAAGTPLGGLLPAGARFPPLPHDGAVLPLLEAVAAGPAHHTVPWCGSLPLPPLLLLRGTAAASIRRIATGSASGVQRILQVSLAAPPPGLSPAHRSVALVLATVALPPLAAADAAAAAAEAAHADEAHATAKRRRFDAAVATDPAAATSLAGATSLLSAAARVAATLLA